VTSEFNGISRVFRVFSARFPRDFYGTSTIILERRNSAARLFAYAEIALL
jgi:hypothetical protein